MNELVNVENNDLCTKIAKQFCFEGKLVSIKKITQGLINMTFRLTYEKPNGLKVRYILQSINIDIFKNPYELMANISKVTCYLKEKILAYGGDPMRETLTIINTIDGEILYKDDESRFWRAYLFIENATAHQNVTAENPDLFYLSAKAFGKFQRLLADFSADELAETIKDFHNTKKRYADFCAAVDNDIAKRAKEVQAEILFIKEREKDCSVIFDLTKSGEIPLRVTHNDTKLNNVMMDNDTHEGICVLDLDTVMPGTLLFDFGDSIRFGASTALEDEKDLSKVSIDMKLFDDYARGYLSETAHTLTKAEGDNLAFGAKLITLEQAMRFLGDYLNGDTYYPVEYPTHNLVRARTQLKLVADMESKFDEMNAIVEKYK